MRKPLSFGQAAAKKRRSGTFAVAETDTEDRHLIDFIGALYDATVDPQLWQSLAVKLAGLFRSESGMVLMAGTPNGSRFLGVTENLQGDFWRDYENYYYAQDEWIAGGLKRPGRALLGQDLAPEDWYRASAFMNEFCARAGIHYLVGAALPLQADRTAIVGIHRPRHETPFGPEDVRRLDILLPHLKRAAQLTIRLSDTGLDRQVALDGLERTHSATLVVDCQSRILFATRLGEMALRRGEGVRVVGGRLAAADRNGSARLAFLVRTAAETASGVAVPAPCGGLAVERGEGRLPVTILVAPFRPKQAAFGAPLPAALVFIRDPEMATLGVEVLRDLFGLTRAQAAVAARMAEGESLEHIAARLAISLHTARDHLKVVFAKTGTSRQPQLVALLTRTVAMLESQLAASE